MYYAVKMKRIQKSLEFTGVKTISLIATFCISMLGFSQTVTNGSVTGAPVGNNLIGPNCPNWNVCGFSPDLCDVGFPSYTGNSQVAPSPSPDGGSWLGMAAVGSGIGECAETTITGLTVGQSYTLCWYGANFGTAALFNGSPSNPTISVGATSITISIPQVANVWTQYTLPFVATAATMPLVCNLPGGDNSYCGLDGFTISVPGATATWTDPSPLCDTDPPINLDALVTGTPGGVWSGTGVTGNTFDPGAGSQNVTYTVNPGTCDEVFMTISVVVNVCVTCDPGWTPPTACSTDPPINLDALITGDTGGTWSGTGVTGNTFDPSAGTQTITYTAPGVCDSIAPIVVTTTAVASWTIPTGLCDSDAPFDLTPFVTGTAGGTWSGTGVTGTMFDPSVGTQNITYTAGTAPCDDAVMQTITVGTQASAAWTPPTGLCTGAAPIDLNTTITGTTGGTWSGTGVTGSMFDPSVGTQNITYTVGTAPCDDVSTQTINVPANADASWTIPLNLCIGDAPIDLNAFVTGNPGGTWSGTGITGSMFDPSVGSQNITYDVGVAPCDASSTQMINVATALDASWTIPTNICETDTPFDMNAFITGDVGGTWTGIGITGSNFDPSVGTQTLTYTVGTGGCQATSAQAVTVDTSPDPSWTTTLLCVSSAPINLDNQITGLPGGTWSGTGMTGSVFDPFFGTQNITYTVSQGACTAMSTQSVTVVDPQVTTTPVHVSCFGLVDGEATANVTGGSGNYTYLWNPSGQTTQTATGLAAGNYQVTVTDVDGGCSVTADVTLLEPDEITLTMAGFDACNPALGSASVTAAGGVGGFTYAWGPSGQTANIAIQLDSAMHTVVVTDANGCTATDSVFVTIWDAPTVTITPDTTMIYGDELMLNATGGVSYSWSPNEDIDCIDCSNPIVTPLNNTVYCVDVTDANGCMNNACVVVNVEIICGDVFVPSAFSPNNDGENDALCVYSDCMEQMTFTIYNRWGEKVYQTSSMNICWDGTWNGKELNSAVFVYVLDGYLINGQHIDQKGNISLIR